MKNLFITLALCFLAAQAAKASDNVTVSLSGRDATMSNGNITIKIGSNGRVSSMTAFGSGNLLSSSGIYFNLTAKKNVGLSPDKAEIIKQTADYAEVLYSNTKSSPIIHQGYILRKGDNGVYSYIIVKGTKHSDTTTLREMRVCVRTASTLLNGYVDDRMNGKIPSISEMKVAEKKENTVQDATYKLADGTVYTKYNWAQYIVNDSVHGLMNDNYGLWNIACSREWQNGGPMKQELTVHATSKSPITIQMLQGEHFGTSAQTYHNGEEKIYGPFYIYANKGTKDEMIADAKKMASEKQKEWPFQWFSNALYPLDRATVSGCINVTTGQRKDSIQVVLAEPNTDVYAQGKKYIFWALTDQDGNFTIKNVRKGNYALYAWALAGDNTDELCQKDINVEDEQMELGTINWTPTCYETKLWQIGSNNRRSDGFNLSDHLRAYGMWNDVPANLNFTIGESKESTDWYYAQTQNGTWTINFKTDKSYTGNLYLTASVAGAANKPKVAVALNGNTRATWSTYSDSGIFRSAMLGGKHNLYKLTIPASLLKTADNKLTLTMSGIKSNGGVMWDCIKLEAGSKVTTGIEQVPETDAVDLVEIYTINGVKMGTYKTLSDAKHLKGIYIYRKGNKIGKISF